MKHRLTHLLALILAFSIAGCGATQTYRGTAQTRSLVGAKYVLPTNAKVGLTFGYDETVTTQVPTTANYGEIKGEDVASGAVRIVAECMFRGFIVLGPLCIAGVTAVLGTAAVVVNVAKASGDDNRRKDRPQQKKSEPTPDELAIEREAIELTQSLARIKPFLERVTDAERASKLKHSTNLPNSEETQYLFNTSANRHDFDYIFELAPLEVEALPVNDQKGTYIFRFTARGRLVRLKDKLVVSEYLRGFLTDFKKIGSWTPEKTELLVVDFENAVDTLAKQFLNEWIKPAFGKEAIRLIPIKTNETEKPVITPAGIIKNPNPTITQTPDAPPAAIIADPSPKSSTSEPCVESAFPRETNPKTAAARDILENRCRN